VTGAVITFSDTARVNGMQWSPPFLGLQISEGDITFLQVINVPEMVYGLLTPEAEAQDFPASGGNGVDANRDGDYCDAEAGDLPPIPSNRANQLFGMVVTLSPENPKERILDFAIDADSGVIGVVYRTADVGGGLGYRTLFAGLEPVDGATAKVDFGVNDFPKRLVFLPGTAVEEERNGETTINFKNLALVSIAGQENRLALIDLTNPAEPSLIHYISLPPDSGVPQSVKSRGDGFVVVATGSKLLLLDPTKLLKADGPEGHPAFVGPLASIGSNTKKYVSDTSGVNITSSGGNSRLSVTSPQIQLLSFPDEAGSIDDILALTEVERAALLLTGRESEFLVPVKLASPAQSTNVTAATSYYVFVNAPGGFGSEIPMSLVSLTRSGKLLPRSSNSEMPRFLTDEASYGTLTGVTNMNAAATVSTGMGAATGNSSMFDTDIIVKRLSGDSKSSVFYNTYLGGPVVLTRRNLEQEDVTGLGSGAEGQRYLKAGAYLWAGLAPKGYSGSLSITNFTSNVVDEKILPGASSLYRVARPRNPLILIHGVAGSHLEINADAAGVSFINELRAKVFSELWPGYHIFDNALQNINIPILPTVAAYTGYAKLLSLEGVDLDSDQELTVVPSDIIRQIPERYNGFLGSGLRLANVDGLEKVYAPLIDYITDDLGYIEYQHGKFNDSGTLVSKSNGGFNANEMHKLRVAPSDDTAPATGDGDSSEGDNNRQRFDDYIHTQVSKHPDFFIFVYDWRLSNVTSAKKLEEFLELVELFHPDLEKVDIVAHSMGGLVARRFIMNHPEKVDKLITLGAPFLGAPKSILTLETGQFLDSGIQHAVIISKKSMRNLAKFFPGAHQLIPFSKYFELEPDAFVEQGWDYNRSGSAYDTFEFSDFHRALDTVRFAGVASTPASESDTFNTAVVTPMTMDGQPGMSIDQSDWSNDPTDVDYYHIYGVQAAPRTIGKIKATRRIRPSLIDTGYFTYREELEVGYVKGDGTVPLISASRMATGGESAGGGGGLNASDAVRIPLVATDDSSAANKLVDHNGMLGNPVLHRTVGTILNEEFEAPTSGVSGSSTVVTTVRIINADRSTVRILDDQGSNLPARVLATLEVAELTGEGDAPPAQFASLQREQFDDHYGVQIYEVDPFVVANSDGSIPARDDEGDGKSDVVEIVTYGEDFQISLEQSGSPVSVRIEQERDGVVERLLIWNEIDDADIPDEEIAPMGLVRRRLDRQMVAGSSNAILISTPDTFEEVPTLKIKRMSDAMGEGDNTVVDGVPVEDGTTEYDLAADTQFEGEAARDQTAESAIICSAFNRNTEFRFFLGDGASGAFVEGARFYFSETDPGLNADLAKLTPLQDENVLNIEQVLASVSGDSVWVVGEDPSKNIANTAPLKVHLVTVTWDISGTHETAQSVVPRGENDWAGMLVYDRPPLDSDTDEDGSAFTPPLVTDDLAEVSLSVIPEGLDTGTVELALETDESRIKVYADPEKMEELTFPLSWDLVFDTVPEKLYIEGFKFSEEVDDVRLKLSYVGTDSQNLDSKLIESQLFLTVPQIVVEPINSDTVEAVNASGIVMGQRNEFRCLVNPVTIPEESIVWSSVNGRVSFILDTGRRVFVAGSSEGEDSLVVGIEGFMGPAPRIDLHVFQSVSEVDVRAFIVARSATGEGAVIRPNEIPDMLAAVSEYYDHVGIEFRLAGEVTYLASPHYTVTGGENWMDVDTNNSFAVPRSIWSTESNTGGIEMYFVRTIDGGLTKGLNRSAGTVDSGILVATRDRIPRRPAEPNDPILTPAQVALEPEDDTLEDAQLYPATVAHELGHACGFVDLYTSRAFPTWGVETEFSPTAPPRKEWIPFDWGSSSEQFSYYPHDVNHVDLIQRLLMHGVLIRGELRPLNTDIPFGYVFASFLVGEESTGIAAPLPVRGQGSVGIKGPGDFRINRSPEH
jgi:pimeloyl-ACP methyl ester carboxylesterase